MCVFLVIKFFLNNMSLDNNAHQLAPIKIVIFDEKNILDLALMYVFPAQ